MESYYINAYIKENSAATIRNRAQYINVTLVSNSNNQYSFSYKGSAKKPYTIKITVQPKTIQSSCTCPFDYGGLCKHEIAALRHIKNNQSKIPPMNKDLFGNTLQKSTHNEIKLIDHILSEDLLHNLGEKNNINYLNPYAIEITSFSKNNITTLYNDWYGYKQTIDYNKSDQLITVTCTCKDAKKKLCIHELSALSYIIEIFGEHYFSPDYIEQEKTKFLKQYGLSIDDDYSNFFEFSFNENGLQVFEKVKNIVPSVSVATKNLLPQFDQKTQNALDVIKTYKPHNSMYGIGFCLSLYKNKNVALFKFIPFSAKYKKYAKEFVSSFKKIDVYSLYNTLERNLPEADKVTIVKALEFSNNYTTFLDNFSIEDYRLAFIAFKDILKLNTEYPFLIKKDKDTLVKKNMLPIAISNEQPNLSFVVSESDDVYTLKPKLKIGEKSYQTNSAKLNVYPFFCIHNQTLYPFKTPYEFLYLNRLQGRPFVNFFKNDYGQLSREFLNPISKHFAIQYKLKSTTKKQKAIAPESLSKQVFLSDYEGEFIIFKLGVQYNNTLVYTHSKEEVYDQKNKSLIKRDDAFENEFEEQFKKLHPDFDHQENIFLLTPMQLIENQWLLTASQKMEQMEIAVFGAKELKSFKYNLNKPKVSLSISSNTDWFDLELTVKYGNQTASLKDIRKAILRKDKYIQLSDGTLGALPKEWLKKFETYFRAGEVKNNTVKISNYQFNIIDELFEDIENTPAFLLDLQRKKEQLYNLQEVSNIKSPKKLKAKLRPYQVEGLNWLAFLEKNKLGGILADDMGLGKTLQVIAFMSYLKEHYKKTTTHLVVVPTSLIFNWENEINKFNPSLKTEKYIGSDRNKKDVSSLKTDIVLTTYGTLINDIEFLKDLEFNWVILDESQAIKNPNSKRYKAARLLNGKNRLALTGTPIENNTFDLYAQMNFLNPGLLGTMSHFKNEFSNAIDKEQNKGASELLSKMIHPFLLRRTKQQVATELPKKTESILYCDMGDKQRKVYEHFKEKYKNYLLEKIDENGAAKSQMYILEGLTKLRQICNCPSLLNEEEDYGKSSVKLDLLIENIKLKTSKHKVLVFSQFTSMLHLIEDRLNNENITYEYLDGKTKNREEKVSNFQSNKQLRVFLISLKAGGTGLNLTEADYVFLIDPWWNPAVENQAIDRSYRIGQKKQVFAYRMICKDTIEEKIMALQKSKKQVSNSIIQVDTIKKSFNKKEIQALFA
ncbi:MAG: DEAD/DEAH box helicase [Winogradskyella sp.]|uniref:DEAD/DEAH box helicase n=1 Tax=Winogradskyella sp. TaxID=1883156 RepID=UPI001845F259|nr:DEAD/DEAH box helicase [Winogradskyella sp.]MBT8244140.1 DEAD/DEAH box helicase [Winogradskyella sp.]NNK21732.1 DEAD/DEAH box helicase [Winogradskyella sp.]